MFSPSHSPFFSRTRALAASAGCLMLAGLVTVAASGCHSAEPTKSSASDLVSPDKLIVVPLPLYWPITYNPGTAYLRTNERVSPPLGLADSQNFAFSMADFDHDGIDDLFCVKTTAAASNTVEVHVLSGASGFSTFLAHQTSAIALSDAVNYTFLFGDYNNDNIIDMYALKTANTLYSVEQLFVYSGADSYRTRLSYSEPMILTNTTEAPPANPVVPFNSVTAYGLGEDSAGDGMRYLYAVATQNTASGFVEITTHLVGPASYGFPLNRHITSLSVGDARSYNHFAMADYNRDGHIDLIGIRGYIDGTHSIELHVWDGNPTSNFTTFLTEDGSDIPELEDYDYAWNFGYAGKFDRFLSIFGVRHIFPVSPAPVNMEVDVLSGQPYCMAGPKGQACAGYACCDSTLSCNGSVCLEANGQACSAASDCAGAACLGGACMTCTPGGQPPSSGNSAQCCPGTFYQGGVCVKPCASPVGNACTVVTFNGQLVKGGCQHGTITACHADGTTVCTPSAPKAESCNQIDDDCDGIVDNLPATACTTTVAGGCSVATGHNVCSGGAPKCEVTAGIDYCTRCGQTVNGASCGDCGSNSCQNNFDCPPNTVCDIVSSNLPLTRACKQLDACSNNVQCWFPSSLTYNRCLACFSPFGVPTGGGNTNICANTTVDGGAPPTDGGAGK